MRNIWVFEGVWFGLIGKNFGSLVDFFEEVGVFEVSAGVRYIF